MRKSQIAHILIAALAFVTVTIFSKGNVATAASYSIKPSKVIHYQKKLPTPTSVYIDSDFGKQYYYYFQKKTPVSARNSFNYAIKQYNKTGIVHLTVTSNPAALKKDPGRNVQLLELGMYYKKGTECGVHAAGHGGQSKKTGGHIDYKGAIYYREIDAFAKYNRYFNAPYTKDVAMHEIGHALGLDHNFLDPHSVMNSNTSSTKLSSSDKLGLKHIYKGIRK